MNIRVRKEYVRCKTCGCVNEFRYLSDYEYGKKLIYLGNDKYAFVNLITDKTYEEFSKRISLSFRKEGKYVSDNKCNQILKETFGITCDEIDNQKVVFNNVKRHCTNCNSTDFEDVMAEQEEFTDEEVQEISHEKWNRLTDDEKNQLVSDVLQRNYSDLIKNRDNEYQYYKFRVGNGMMRRNGVSIEYVNRNNEWVVDMSLIGKFIGGDCDYVEITPEEAETIMKDRKAKKPKSDM